MIKRKSVRYLIPAAIFLGLFLMMTLYPTPGSLWIRILELIFAASYLVKAAKEYREETKADKQLRGPPSPDES